MQWAPVMRACRTPASPTSATTSPPSPLLAGFCPAADDKGAGMIAYTLGDATEYRRVPDGQNTGEKPPMAHSHPEVTPGMEAHRDTGPTEETLLNIV